ncbi:MAG: hypothetical protein IIV13_02430 [Bacteroidaceae bacterium]|nr:hypothetical protein [Bacteroidaceae bacterium]
MKFTVFLAGIGYLCFAAIDFLGFTFHLQKKYRTNQRIVDSRKKVAALNLVIGTAGICYSFFTDITSPIAVLVALLIIVAFFVRALYVRHIMEKAEHKDE